MRHRTTAFMALGAIAVLLAASQIASANRLKLNTNTFRIAWSRATFSGSGISISCPMTLAGSFHSRTISKTRGLLIGYVNSGSIGGCSGGNASLLAGTLPWHVRYESFAGRLPIIESVRLDMVGASFLLEALGISCLYRSTTTNPSRATANLVTLEWDVASMTADATATIPLNSGSFLCPSQGAIAGTGTVTQSGSANPVRVILLEAPPGQIRVEPTAVSLPVRGQRTITVTNRAAAGSQNIKITSNSLEFVDNPGLFEILPGETCEEAVLLPLEANSCRITVKYDEAFEARRPLEDNLRFGHISGDALETRQEILVRAE